MGATAVSILAWHEISDRPSPTAVPPRRFAAQVDLLRDMGLAPVPLEEGASAGGRGVALTFDDGHLETYTRAYPILAGRGLTATVYVATGFVSTAGWFEPGGRPMTWAMVRELHRSGWTIGSHTVRHGRLTGLDDAGLERELTASRAALEDALGSPCRHFCAPYGDMDDRVRQAALAAGYRTLALSVPVRHRLRETAGVLARSGVYPGTSWWAFRVKARGWDARIRGRALASRGGAAGAD